MNNLFNLKGHYRFCETAQKAESYTRYLELLSTSELILEAKHLEKNLEFNEISTEVKAKGKSLITELVNRIEQKELLTCSSLNKL